MAQATSGDRPTSSDRRPAGWGLILVFIAVVGFAAAVFIVEPQIVNPSITSCLLLIVGPPLLAIARVLDQKSRRRQLAEIRDARRSGISIGNARRPRELAQTTELAAELAAELDLVLGLDLDDDLNLDGEPKLDGDLNQDGDSQVDAANRTDVSRVDVSSVDVSRTDVSRTDSGRVDVSRTKVSRVDVSRVDAGRHADAANREG